MEKKKLSGGVVGFGKMGLVHSAIINVSENSRLCAICESSEIIHKLISQLIPDIKIYKDYKEMLEKEKLDFVFITTPTFLHVPVALECVKHGCNFFMEKPVSTNEAEAKPLLDTLLKEQTLVTMVGYMMRYIDTFQYAKGILDSRVLGSIISFNATMYVSQLFKTGKGWRYDKKESGGGCIITQASHVIDLICWFFGMPRAVNGRTISHYSKNVEDFGHVTLAWKDGLMGWLDSSWSIDNHRMLETTFTIHGENGTLIVDDDFVKLFMRKKTKEFSDGWTIKSKPELFSGAALDIGAPHFTKQDEDFIRAIMTGKKVESDAASGCRVQRVVDCIYKSAESDGQTVLI